MANFNLGAAAIRTPSPSEGAILRLDITTSSESDIRASLRALTVVLQDYLAGLDREPHRADDIIDRRGWKQTALVGFGPGFFRRADGVPRFRIKASPRGLRPLRSAWDKRSGLDAEALQADLLVLLETDNHQLLMDGVERLLAHVRQSDVLLLRDLHFGARRGDGRNKLGFIDGAQNPGNPGAPAIDSVAFAPREALPHGLEGGSYLVFKKYRLDLELWRSLSPKDQEQIIGSSRATGERIRSQPNSHASLAAQDGGGWIYRRGLSVSAMRPDGEYEHGLLFLSFQASIETFESFYDRLTNSAFGLDLLLSHPSVGSLNSDVYFVPDFNTWQWGFVGQAFFEPEPYQLAIDGNLALEQGDIAAATKNFELCRTRYPSHVLGYSEAANLYGEIGSFDLAVQWGREAARLAPDNYLVLGSLAWAEYGAGLYEDAARHARRAAEGAFADDYRAFPYHTYAAALVMLGEGPAAEVAARRALARVPGDVLLQFTLATALETQGRHREAAEAYEQVLARAQRRIATNQVDPLSGLVEFRIPLIAFSSVQADQTKRDLRLLLREYEPSATSLHGY